MGGRGRGQWGVKKKQFHKIFLEYKKKTGTNYIII